METDGAPPGISHGNPRFGNDLGHYFLSFICPITSPALQRGLMPEAQPPHHALQGLFPKMAPPPDRLRAKQISLDSLLFDTEGPSAPQISPDMLISAVASLFPSPAVSVSAIAGSC